MRDQIKDLLAVDPLAEAEQITGKSYKDDEDTAALGFALHLANSAAKKHALTSAGDTHFSSTFAEQLDVMAGLGFTEVLHDSFTSKWGYDETFVILWHEDGLLAEVESYSGTRRNTAKVWYNIRPDDRRDFWSYTSSGHYTDDYVWCGDHDIREGAAAKINGLREHGEFLPVWQASPFLWLLTYAETEGHFDYEAINASRINRLPAHVRAAVSA